MSIYVPYITKKRSESVYIGLSLKAEQNLSYFYFGLNIFYSSQDMIKNQAEQKAMFSPLHTFILELNHQGNT